LDQVLDRDLAEIVDRMPDEPWIVMECTQPGVALKTQHPADLTGLVIVIDLRRRPLLANRAQPTLSIDEFLNLGRPNAVPVTKTIVTVSTM
jgi:hypothetical protein